MVELLDSGVRAAYLRRLKDATARGVLKWTPSETRAHWYFAQLPGGYTVAIESADDDDAPPFDFHIFKQDREDDYEAAVKVDEWRWDRSGRSGVNLFLDDLYLAAKSDVLGVTNLANDLFGAVSALDGGPSEPESLALSDNPDSDPFPF